MPKIGHIVFAKETMKQRNSNKLVLVEPFSHLEAPKLPYTDTFVVNVGLFNLRHSVEYEFAYFIYSPTGEKITGKFMDVFPEPKGSKDFNSNEPVHITLNLGLENITFEEEGVHCFLFQINNLHEEKSCYFYVQKGDQNG
ncbi:hypothetical protein [Gracilibacillus lacisalsi]|uniref:hypothetical protein n=1 Tax=Gracilibacillus lacisalsi TaxID=393087 RepID=UPI0003643E86|nr:hypothetical protein [Gracilibacillus lacisalsi]